LILGPYDTVRPVRVSGGRRQKPHAGIRSKHLRKVLISTHVKHIGTSIWVPLSLQVVQSRRVCQHQLNVESEEHGNHHKEGDLDQETDCLDDEIN